MLLIVVLVVVSVLLLVMVLSARVGVGSVVGVVVDVFTVIRAFVYLICCITIRRVESNVFLLPLTAVPSPLHRVYGRVVCCWTPGHTFVAIVDLDETGRGHRSRPLDLQIVLLRLCLFGL